MNTINFNQVGGFPFSTNILAKLQTAFSIFNALGNIVGDLTIISGCEVAGDNVGNGVVYINGEVLEFRGGLAQTKVIIKEDVESLLFENQNSYPVVKTRYATFGTGVGAINWVDFKRGYQTKNLLAALASKADDSIVTAIAEAVALIITKLNTIETGAQKNVRSDWDATDGDKAIDNKPDFEESGILFTGSVLANGNKATWYKVNFSSTLGNGVYKIVHNLGHLNYAVTGSGTTDATYKVAMRSKTENECILGVSDDNSLNVGDFAFIVFKL